MIVLPGFRFAAAANGLRMPSTAEELAAAMRIDFSRVTGFRNQRFSLSMDAIGTSPPNSERLSRTGNLADRNEAWSRQEHYNPW